MRILAGIPNLKERDRFNAYQPEIIRCIKEALVGVSHSVCVSPPSNTKGIPGIIECQNYLIEKALKEEFDYLWLVQADVQVPRNAFSDLFGLDVDVGLGVVPRHDDSEALICGFLDEEMRVWYLPRKAVEGQVLSGWVFAGASCMLIKCRVLKAGIRFRYSAGVGEDVLLMFDLQKAGFKAKVDGRVQCGHFPEWPLSPPSISFLNRRDC